jgi:hypothetical protein
MTKPADKWVYGQSPSPTNWDEACRVLNQINKDKAKPKSGGLLDRLDAIEKLLKDKK